MTTTNATTPTRPDMLDVMWPGGYDGEWPRTTEARLAELSKLSTDDQIAVLFGEVERLTKLTDAMLSALSMASAILGIYGADYVPQDPWGKPAETDVEMARCQAEDALGSLSGLSGVLARFRVSGRDYLPGDWAGER